MPGQVEDYLRSLNTSDRARAAAWDAVYSVKDDAQAQSLIRQLPFNDDVKATLWDARKGLEVAVPQAQTQEAPTPQPSAASRFFSNAGAVLNPIEAVKGLASAVAHPIATATGLYNAHAEQFGKARDAFGEGRYSEAIGHGMASALPILGPVAASAGE